MNDNQKKCKIEETKQKLMESFFYKLSIKDISRLIETKESNPFYKTLVKKAKNELQYRKSLLS